MFLPPISEIRVAAVDATLREQLLRLRVTPAQRGYVGAIGDLLADAACCPDSAPMAILHNGVPVGYYRIDPNARSVAGHDLERPALGLRAFFIDARSQGRGLGARALAALLGDVVVRHPHARMLALAVHVDNHAAQRLYRRAGFSDGGELYHGGRSGAQRLLLRGLP